MPLIIICGCPGSGKSEVAASLERLLDAHGLKHCVVAHRGMQDYADAGTEKMARGELFSAVERLVSPSVTVICDACNYIGGFRYQLFCSAKALQTSTLCLWCHGGDEQGELGSRFEAPKEKNRWDRPLIVARRNADTGKMEFDEERVLAALKGQVLAGPNLSTIAEPRGQAVNVDHELTQCINDIMAAQKEGMKSGLSRSVTMKELRLWKREYLQLQDLADVSKTRDVKKSFLGFCQVKQAE